MKGQIKDDSAAATDNTQYAQDASNTANANAGEVYYDPQNTYYDDAGYPFYYDEHGTAHYYNSAPQTYENNNAEGGQYY